MAEQKKTICPVTVIALEVLDKKISDLQKQIGDLSTSMDVLDPADVLFNSNKIKLLSEDLTKTLSEKADRQLEQNRLISLISNCLGRHGGVLGGVEYEACCPYKGMCTCAGTTKIDVFVGFESIGATVTDVHGHTIPVIPFEDLCANNDFCQQDHIVNPRLKAFMYGDLAVPTLGHVLPLNIVIGGISYPILN
jgi:hypothetical protein